MIASTCGVSKRLSCYSGLPLFSHIFITIGISRCPITIFFIQMFMPHDNTCSGVAMEKRTNPPWKKPTGVALCFDEILFSHVPTYFTSYILLFGGDDDVICGYSPPVPFSGCCLKLSQPPDDVTHQLPRSSRHRCKWPSPHTYCL